MSETAARIALQARWVFPMTSPPIESGIVTLLGNTIVAVGENLSGKSPRDLGNVALLPGLINAHTHLEFSNLRAPVGQPSMAFADWIEAVVTMRRDHAHQDDAALSPARRVEAIRSGLQQCLRGGTTTVADIATGDVRPDAIPLTAPRYLAMRELIGLADDQAMQRWADAQAFVAHVPRAPSRYLPGLSPHAPYTVPLELVEQVADLSARHNLPVAMHMAESREERQLLAQGDGPLADLLKRLGVWHAPSFPGQRTSRDYLQALCAAHRALIVHGNYLERPEWSYLADHAKTMAVVYCPRTHAWFGHRPYPLASMLQAGVNVVLGTDSLASNPDLNLWSELRFAARCQPEVDRHLLLRMVTVDAARALGLDNEIGSLEADRRADLTVVRWDTDTDDRKAPDDDPCSQLLDRPTALSAVWTGGTEHRIR